MCFFFFFFVFVFCVFVFLVLFFVFLCFLFFGFVFLFLFVFFGFVSVFFLFFSRSFSHFSCCFLYKIAHKAFTYLPSRFGERQIIPICSNLLWTKHRCLGLQGECRGADALGHFVPSLIGAVLFLTYRPAER